MFIKRRIYKDMARVSESPVGRGLILTGARQTGKTTLLQREFVPPYEYHTFDEPLVRAELAGLPSSRWIARGKSYIFDEVQKAPDFLGTVKVMLDAGPESLRVILSGSAQIQLLATVRESLAGRSVTRELFGLMASELAGTERCFFEMLLDCDTPKEVAEVMDALPIGDQAIGARLQTQEALAHLETWGGMPALIHLKKDSDRWIWLEEYCRTYLQRDVSDLGRVHDLDDFLRLERLAAGRTAGLLNYADLARDADLAPQTTKKYLRYLDLSYQTYRLPAFGPAGSTKRLQKAPKLHFLDLGIQRVLSGLRLGLTGPQFESLMVGEVLKLNRGLRLGAELSHLRTQDRREVDLLVRCPGGGYLAFEIKAGDRAAPPDAHHLRGLQALLDGPLLGGFVIHRGTKVETWADNLHGLPAAVLLGPAPM